uniref:AlNc14C314G10518 protein n=1 Tax=Albugo laibachii Nc14 TaxID=890382 RepID=F0WW77_9STRA|nr:AlNc14C314G10518 [Albugo laibachii Nc14]|eukprot:CCA25696.1 AlNc14C314G10518 [Albugo laibachii Nc14]
MENMEQMRNNTHIRFEIYQSGTAIATEVSAIATVVLTIATDVLTIATDVLIIATEGSIQLGCIHATKTKEL